jgi:Flp pilus assembly protein TadG
VIDERFPPRRRRRRDIGQALAEFALVAPIFFLILFGIIDFGRYVYYVQVLNNAAREGARYAIVHGSRSLAPTGPPASGTITSDYDGANVVSTTRGYATGVIGDSTVLAIVPTWWHYGSEPDPAAPLNGGDGDNGRENLVQVIVTYQFRSLIPVVPIPPIEVKGSATLVVNN